MLRCEHISPFTHINMRKTLYGITIGIIATFIFQNILISTFEITHAEENPQKNIVITEIAATEIANLEWIEIQNIGNLSINLENWKFIENGTNHGLTLFQGEVFLRSGEIAIIANKASELKTLHPLLENTIFDSTWGSLKESGEEIGLKDENEELIELFTYLPNSENTLQKINPNSNDYSSSNWTEAIHTIGKENFYSDSSNANLIIEKSATPNIEIVPATQNIKVLPATQGVIIQNTEPQEPEILKPHAIISIQSGVTKARGKVTINLDGSSSSDPQDEALTFYWDFNDGTIYENKNPRSKTYREPGHYLVTLRVTNESGFFEETTLDITVLPEIEIIENTTTTPSPNTSTPTKNANEDQPSKKVEAEVKKSPPETPIPKTYHTILLNEILPNPTGKDQGQEWIEIYNPNEFPVNIKDYIIDDYTDGGSKPMKLKEIEIAPISHYLLFDPSINLNNSNEELQILDPNGTLLDKIYFSESFEGQSLARFKNEWLWTTFPTPNFKNEIISDSLDIKEKSNENEYQNGGLSSEIYISELLPNPHGEDAKEEWIELYNASFQSVNLGNWVLDDNEKGSKPYTLPDDKIIPAKGYLTIDRTESKLSLDNRGDQVRLFNFEEELQDEVLYEKAKESLSFSKLTLTDENSTGTEWQWTPKLTKSKPNPSLYRIRGEIEDKIEDIVLIKAKEFSLKESNELNEMVLSPGNLVELTYDETNEIKDYTLIKERPPENNKKDKNQLIEILKILGILGLVAIYLIMKRRKPQKEKDVT